MGSVSWDWPHFPPRVAKFIETGQIPYSFNVVNHLSMDDYEAEYEDDGSMWVIVYAFAALVIFVLIFMFLIVWTRYSNG